MTNDDVSTARSILESPRPVATAADVTALLALLDADDAAHRRLAVTALQTVASRSPSLLREALDDDLDPVRSICADPDASIRATGTILLSSVAGSESERTHHAIDILSGLLDDESDLVRGKALAGIRRLGPSEPRALPPLVDAIVPFLDATDGTTRGHAVAILAMAASADGESVAAATPRLLDLFRVGEEGGSSLATGATTARRDQGVRDRLDSMHGERWARHRSTRQLAGHALAQLAVADPDAVAPMVGDLAALLDDPDPQVRVAALDAFVALADGKPDAVIAFRERLTERLAEDGAETARSRAAQALAALGVHRPDDVAASVFEHTDALALLLENDDPPVRGAGANLLALAATHDSAVVEPAEDRLRALLGDDAEYVRAAAAHALEFVD